MLSQSSWYNEEKTEGNEKMKKLVMVSVLGIGLVLLGACGDKQFFDTTYTFNYAMVKLVDGTIKKAR